MKRFLLSMLFVLGLTVAVIGAEPIKKEAVPQYLQDISVTIRAGNGFSAGEGSGVLKQTKDGQVWVWTCGHVVVHARKERESPDKRPLVEFDDVKIVKTLVEDGRKVGELNFEAEVIRYSDADFGDDLALLRLRTKKFKPNSSAVFYLDNTIPPLGTELYHCGSLLGSLGSNSLTSGLMSQHGRLLFNKVFDQTTCAAFPGSSGGPVVLKDDGRYVGMVVRGAGETFNLTVPVRRMRDWSKKVGVEFALDDAVAVPTDDELKKKPIDDGVRQASISAADKAHSAAAKEYPFKHIETATVVTYPGKKVELLIPNIMPSK